MSEEYNMEQEELFYDLLENAQNEKSLLAKKRYLKKALEIKPEDVDANLQLINVEGVKDIFKMEDKLNSLIEKERQKLESENYFKDCLGEFWLVFETRPYMRALLSKLQMLLSLSRTKEAIGLAEHMLELCENDNLGIRLKLMSLYAEMLEMEKALALNKKYENDISPFMQLPIAVLYYRLGKYSDCDKILKKINKENQYLLGLIADEYYPEELPPFYSFGSIEEAESVIDTNSSLLFSLSELPTYLEKKGYKI